VNARDTTIGLAVSTIAVGAMAIDHLIGTEPEPGDEGGLADPPAFLISTGVSLALAAILFGVVVRRAAQNSERVARNAILLSGLSVPALALLFLGVPFPLAGAGIALGLRAREESRTRLATAAVVIGALVILLGAGAYVVALVA
jgi:hypothetical protein